MSSHFVPPPPCPHCSQQLHPQHAFDGYQCRCGYTISCESVVAIQAACASLGPDEVANGMRANGRIEQRPQFEPGIHISAEFSSIAARLWCRRFNSSLLSPGVTRDIDIAVRAELQRQRLVCQSQEAFGEFMVVQREDGNQDRLERGMVYGITPLDQLAECARQMVHVIAMTRGPGRIWFLRDPVHPIDDGGLHVGDVGGVPHVIMRSVYFHDPEQETSVGRVDRAIKEAELAARKLAAHRVDPAEFLAKRNEQRLAHLAMMTRAMVSEGVPPPAGLENATTLTLAGRFDAVLAMAQSGVITREQARELLDMPEPGPFPYRAYPSSFTTKPDGTTETTWSSTEVDPLLVKYDDVALRHLVEIDDAIRQERSAYDCWVSAGYTGPLPIPMTKLQRDAVSAYLSDQLRAKVKASVEADKARQVSIVVDSEEW